jgi:predicted transcriptional regulator
MVSERTEATLKMPGGPLEWSVMSALWEAPEPLTVRAVQDVIDPKGKLAYTSVATVLDRLVEKKLAAKEPGGRAHVYRATYTRALVETAQAREALAQFLKAGPEPAALTIIEAAASLDENLVDALGKIIAKRRKRNGT